MTEELALKTFNKHARYHELNKSEGYYEIGGVMGLDTREVLFYLAEQMFGLKLEGGWQGKVSECDEDYESEGSHYLTHNCPECGGCIEYDMSEEVGLKWNEWSNELRKGKEG